VVKFAMMVQTMVFQTSVMLCAQDKHLPHVGILLLSQVKNVTMEMQYKQICVPILVLGLFVEMDSSKIQMVILNLSSVMMEIMLMVMVVQQRV